MSRLPILLLAVCLACLARADGTFAKLGGALAHPGIPYQRAVVAHHDGLEMLLVESTLDGPAGEYVWIVPVPKPPTRVMAVDEFGLYRLQMGQFAPSMRSEAPSSGFYRWAGIWFGILGLATLALGIDRSRRERTAVAVVGVALAGAVGIVFFSPAASAAKMAATAGGVTSISAHRAGNYRVDVLSANDPEALAKWMAKRGGRLEGAAKAAVAAYVRDGWCFAVAQLRSHNGGQATPHPLAIEFRTPRPIYPMRLTGTQPGRLMLDLYVIADGTAVVPPLRPWISTQYTKGRVRSDTPVDEDTLSASALEAMAWKGAIVTRLRGEVSPAEMARDYEIQTKPFEKYRIRLVTTSIVEETRMAWLFLAAGASLLVAALATAFAGLPLGKRVLIAAVLSAVVGGMAYQATTAGLERIESGVYRVVEES
jgi:hypothetical protein